MLLRGLSILLLPLLIHARIKVTITASDKDGDRQIHLSGTDTTTITDTEINTFGLTNENLMNSIQKYFGQRPDHAFLKSPTPWGDLYKTFNWPEVTRVLTPLKAKILTVTTHPMVVATFIYNNTNPKPSTFTAKVKEQAQNTLTSIWETTGELTPPDIDYEFDVKSDSIMGKNWFTYSAKWGQEVVKSEIITVGLESGLEIALDPKQTAIAELHATKGTMRIQMDYEATLTGSTAVNFDKAYKGHHFWGLGIDSVMSAGDLRNSVKSSEVIEIRYYTEPKLIVSNMETNEMMYSIPMKIYYS